MSTCENSLCLHSMYVTRCIALRRTLVWFEQHIYFVQPCTQILFEFETSGSKRQRDFRFTFRGELKFECAIKCIVYNFICRLFVN